MWINFAFVFQKNQTNGKVKTITVRLLFHFKTRRSIQFVV
jgi:hypothetical protein